MKRGTNIPGVEKGGENLKKILKGVTHHQTAMKGGKKKGTGGGRRVKILAS